MTDADADAPQRLSADRVTITSGHGPLSAGALLNLVVDAGGITLHGGEPVTAWQIPFSAMSMMAATTHGHDVEVAGWVSGEYLALGFPRQALEGGTPDDLEALVAAGTGRVALGAEISPPRSMRIWLLAALGMVAVAIGVVVAVVLSSSSPSPVKATAQDKALAGSKNLVRSDVPSEWGTDDPTTAPLAGLLGSARTSSTPSAASKKAYKTVIAGFQSCMGETNATDRVFGAAGVTPLVQVPSAPFGRVTSTSYIEAGSVTQRYASAKSVAADLAQMKSPKFPTCFAQAIGRLVMSSADPTLATATVSVTPQTLPAPLGVVTAGANVFVQIPTAATTVDAEIGITMLVSGTYEQTLYTFSLPGEFPTELRSELVSLLAGRLVGSSGATPA